VGSQPLNSIKGVNAFFTPLYPTSFHIAALLIEYGNNNTTVMMSSTASTSFSVPQLALGVLVEPSLVITNTVTTSFFLTKGAPF
jgi:hypothetical protein